MLWLSMFDVFAYVRSNGKCPYAEWFDGLDQHTAARVVKATNRMEDGNFGDHKSVGGGVIERRLDFGPGYRIYYGRDGKRLVVLLGGGAKKRQGRDIEAAQAMWADYKATKLEK